jgi:hypothetical protein
MDESVLESIQDSLTELNGVIHDDPMNEEVQQVGSAYWLG